MDKLTSALKGGADLNLLLSNCFYVVVVINFYTLVAFGCSLHLMWLKRPSLQILGLLKIVESQRLLMINTGDMRAQQPQR